jgi:hypothetical protein
MDDNKWIYTHDRLVRNGGWRYSDDDRPTTTPGAETEMGSWR